MAEFHATYCINHVSLAVSDLARAQAFYEGVLGWRRLPRPSLADPGVWYDLTGGQAIHLLATAEGPQPGDHAPGRGAHVAFFVTDLETLKAQLMAAGTRIIHSRSGRPAFFCRDPDGNSLEFIAGPPLKPAPTE